MHTLALEHSEEALAGSIVGTTTHGTHAAHQVMAFQEALILVARELASTLGMEHHRASILALPKRHQHCLQHQLPILAMAHRPADDDTRVEVKDDTQI